MCDLTESECNKDERQGVDLLTFLFSGYFILVKGGNGLAWRLYFIWETHKAL